MTRARTAIIAVITASFMVVGLSACKTKKQKHRKKQRQFKRYESQTLSIVNSAFKRYRNLGNWLGAYTKPQHKAYERQIQTRLNNFKSLIARLEKVEPGNDEIRAFKKNDMGILVAIRGIYKIVKKQLKNGKRPKRTPEILALEKEFRERNRQYKEMRAEYKRKYKVGVVRASTGRRRGMRSRRRKKKRRR